MLPVVVRCVPSRCCTSCTVVRVGAVHFRPLLLRDVRALLVHPTVRLDAAHMLRFWWMIPVLPLSSFILLVGVAATITDNGRGQGLYLAACWHTDITATCSRPQNNISASVDSLPVVPIPPPLPTLLLPVALLADSKQQHVYPRGKGLLAAGLGRPRAQTWMPTRQRELAQDTLTRDGGNRRRRVPLTSQIT